MLYPFVRDAPKRT